jgi:hypothetical protein
MSIAQYIMLSIKEWVKDNRQNLYLFFGVLLVGILAFESGFLRGQLVQSEPLIVSIPATAESPNNKTTEIAAENQPVQTESKTLQTDVKQETEKCLFVGSKNSNKYHLPACAVAKRIKPENKVCFASKEDAEKRGYVPSCIK